MKIKRKNVQKIFCLIALGAMALTLLAQTTPLWAKTTDGQTIEICSAFGNRTILVDENFREIPSAPIKDSAQKKHCDTCFVSSAHLQTPAEIIIPHSKTRHSTHLTMFAEHSFVQKLKYAPQKSRAPPKLS